MKLKNKLLIIILFFSAFLIFNNSKVRASSDYYFFDPATAISSVAELDYDEAKNICESSDSSKYPSDYSESNYPYFLVLKTDSNCYKVYYSSAPIRVVAYCYYSEYTTSKIKINPVKKNGSFKCFSYIYSNSAFSYYSGFVDGGNGNKTVGYYSNHNVYFATPPCDYGVASSLNSNSVLYSNVSSFFLAKCQISPFNTGLKAVESTLIPTQILGTLKTLITPILVVFSALLVISLIKSKHLLQI